MTGQCARFLEASVVAGLNIVTARRHPGRQDHPGHCAWTTSAPRATEDPSGPPHGRTPPVRGRGARRAHEHAGQPRGLRVRWPEGWRALGFDLPQPVLAPGSQRCGLQGVRIHDLRHAAVALWIVAGANPKEVAARAGHASVSFTLDRYGHLYPEADLMLRERLQAIYAASIDAT
jgi:hypothetical protein